MDTGVDQSIYVTGRMLGIEMNLRCAIYARYSSDLQSPSSIEDQVRKCREYAQRQGWVVLDEHVYSDAALSGAGVDRPSLQRLLGCIKQRIRKFDVLLIDDTSRLARNPGEQQRIVDDLRFREVRMVSVSQGIDSSSDQADVLLTVHGLTDSLYIKRTGQENSSRTGRQGLAWTARRWALLWLSERIWA